MVTAVSARKAATPRRRYVNSSNDFKIHTESHIARVKRLGMELRRARPEELGDVPETMIEEFLGLHDQAKINPGLAPGRARPYLLELYDVYGKKLNPDELKGTRRIIDAINDIDQRVAMDFFKKNGLLDSTGKPGPIARKLLEIEKAADLADRGMSPVATEEFGRPMEPASRFFEKKSEQVRNNPDLSAEQKSSQLRELEKEIQFARTLEQPGVYDRITQGLDFETQRRTLIFQFLNQQLFN